MSREKAIDKALDEWAATVPGGADYKECAAFKKGYRVHRAHAVEVLDQTAESFEFEADQLLHCTTRQCRTAAKASKAAALALRDVAAELKGE